MEAGGALTSSLCSGRGTIDACSRAMSSLLLPTSLSPCRRRMALIAPTSSSPTLVVYSARAAAVGEEERELFFSAFSTVWGDRSSSAEAVGGADGRVSLR